MLLLDVNPIINYHYDVWFPSSHELISEHIVLFITVYFTLSIICRFNDA